MNTLANAPVLVVGAGIMGAGIAQVAAQAGHAVMLHDTREGAAAAARARLGATLDGLVAKGKLEAGGGAGHAGAHRARRRRWPQRPARGWWSRPSSSSSMPSARCSASSKAWSPPTPCWPPTPRRSASPPSPRGCSIRAGWSACTSSTRCR
jgi:hypothetical protein